MNKKLSIFLLIVCMAASLIWLPVYAAGDTIPPNAGEQYGLVTKWGTLGSGKGEFWNPTGIAVDSAGNVYVADRDNHRIQTFTGDGTYINEWGWYGPLDGQMRFPSGVAIDKSGNVYVTDTENYRVQKFSSEGVFIAKWGTEVVPRETSCDCTKRTDGQFLFPEEITVDSSGNVYVIDNCVIQKFSSTGQFIKNWHDAGVCADEGDFHGNSSLLGISADSNGNIYFIGQEPPSAPEDYHRIYEYSSDGAFIRKWGSGEEGEDSPPVGEFWDWSGIAVDSSNNVYAVDRKYTNSTKIRIQKFTPDGQFLTQWIFDREDINETEVLNTGIAIDTKGNVYVINGNIIDKFAITTNPQTTTTTTASGGTSTTTTTPSGTTPVASFTVTPDSGSVATDFTVDASGSKDAKGDTATLVVRWDWENDGTWDTAYSTTKTATHRYVTEGVYTIRLEVKDTGGLTDTTTKVVTVTSQRICPAAYLLGNNDPRLAVLRQFRDKVLNDSDAGKKLIAFYYTNEDKIIEALEKNPALKESTKKLLILTIPTIEKIVGITK